ncbi:2'-5' RNA ligase family protein [bacterium]|nr:MAG: 2'-5' RNA ligase family protein [bacterium]
MSFPQVTTEAPLLITLQFDSDSFKRLNELRELYFPSERNFIPAHLTLFHALPGEHEGLIRENLTELCAQTGTLDLQFTDLRSLGRGVAINVECHELKRLRAELARTFRPFLSPQDAQHWKHPHVTIQNKVTPETARATLSQLNKEWREWNGQGDGLFLWYYRGGPWEKAGDYLFTLENDN